MRKILSLSAALLCATSLMAQKDITSQYIKNATLSDGTNGWTVSGFNTPVKGNNTVGYASEAYAGWGSLDLTSYSLTQEITLPAGSYRLVNYSFYRYGEGYNTDASKSMCKLFAGKDSVAIKTLGSITAGGYANSQAEGANAFDSKMYRNVLEFTVPEGGSTFNIGLTGTHVELKSWIIAGMFELYDLNEKATSDNPTDVTYAITNSGFEYRSMEGWTLSESEDGAIGVQSNASFSSKAGGYYCEKWQASENGGLSDRSISQTLTGMPAGYYTLSAYAKYGGTGASIFANDQTVAVGDEGKYSVNVKVKEGEDLKIGLQLVSGTSNWIAVDRFTLSYYPIDLDALQSSFAKLQTEATALAASAMNADVLAALNAAAVTPKANEDSLLAATTVLTEAIASAKTSIANYEEAAAQLAKADVFDETGKAAFQADETYKAVSAAYTDRTLTAVSADQKTALNTALISAAKQQTTAGADMSLALPGNTKADWTNGSGVYNSVGAERYSTSAYTPGKILYQTIRGLHSGIYEISFYATANMAHIGVATGDGIAQVYANNKTENIAVIDQTSCTLTDYLRTFTVRVDSTLEYGLQNIGTGGNWYVAAGVALKYVSAAANFDSLQATVTAAETAKGEIKDEALVAELQTAIEAATLVLNNDLADQTTVDAAIKTLNDAVVLVQKKQRAQEYVFTENAYFSWESPEGIECTKGGKLTTSTSNTGRVNYTNAGNYTISLNGKPENVVTDGYILLTLDEGLTFNAGDKINVTGYYNKGAQKNVSFLMQFMPSGTQLVDTEDWKDINSANTADYSATPETFTYTIPAGVVGDTMVYITRKLTGTTLFITKLEFVPDSSTGISQFAGEAVEGAIYDLQGRKVSTMVNGQLYVQGGKVVMAR